MFGALEGWASYVKVSFFTFFLLININAITKIYFAIVRVKCKSIKKVDFNSIE